MNQIRLTFLLVFCMNTSFGVAQDSIVENRSPNAISFRLNYGHGKVIATNDFLRTKNKNGTPINQARNVTAEIILQTTGKKDWHQLNNFPKYGFGLQYMWFPQTDEIGSPLSAYALMEGSIHKWKDSQLDWAFHFGMSFGWNPFDSVSNPYNVLLGSKGSIYAHLGVLYHHNLGNRFGLEASLGFSHSSNGALKMPNFGINILDPRLAVTYSLSNERPVLKPHKLSEFTRSNELSLSYAIGTKQIDVSGSKPKYQQQFDQTSFTIYNFVLLYQRHISRRSNIGAGIDFTVDPSDNAHGLAYGDINTTYPVPFKEQAKLALVLSYEYKLGRLSLILQPGFYFYRTTHDPTPFFYQRIGTRYTIYKGFYAGASLRAVNFGQADWIEFTIGYKVKF
jgi:hypothetical protein